MEKRCPSKPLNPTLLDQTHTPCRKHAGRFSHIYRSSDNSIFFSVGWSSTPRKKNELKIQFQGDARKRKQGEKGGGGRRGYQTHQDKQRSNSKKTKIPWVVAKKNHTPHTHHRTDTKKRAVKNKGSSNPSPPPPSKYYTRPILIRYSCMGPKHYST